MSLLRALLPRRFPPAASPISRNFATQSPVVAAAAAGSLAEVRKPSIRFPDRTNPPAPHAETHPHPAAPTAVVEDFARFRSQFASGPHFDASKLRPASELAQSSTAAAASSTSSAKTQAREHDHDAVDDVRQLPRRFWATPSTVMGEEEMEAIMSGGASLV